MCMTVVRQKIFDFKVGQRCLEDWGHRICTLYFYITTLRSRLVCACNDADEADSLARCLGDVGLLETLSWLLETKGANCQLLNS